MSQSQCTSITNLHVIDSSNIGDLLSSPLHYFDFPGYQSASEDIRNINQDNISNTHLIVGGGGLLYKRFLPQFETINASKNKAKFILWGAGYQQYTCRPEVLLSSFDSSSYLSNFDLIGIRDNHTSYDWVPCVSCMHTAFDKPRSPQHEAVVFSHKKFRIDVPGLPKLSNQESDFERVLDFLGSGETILTSSFHGAYWGLLLGRRVIAFPFSTKFFTLRHAPAFYPVQKWSRDKFKVSIFGKVLHSSKYAEKKLECQILNWQKYRDKAPIYADILEEYRERNRWFYSQVMSTLND
jgi:hypothetical protein